MKKMILFALLSVMSLSLSASFTHARIKVTGVTCSMCSNSVQKALQSLSFIEKIDVDLENAVFRLSFKTGEKVEIDEIRKKVEGAGFSIGELIADFSFDRLKIEKDFHFAYQGDVYHFVNVGSRELNDQIPLRFVDKGFAGAKAHKRHTASSQLKCIKSGKPESCCASASKNPIGRVYHVTL